MDNSTKRHFSFVNLKHPDDLKDEETQLRIRRLAMTEVGRARRKPKSNKSRNEIILEFRGSTLDQSNLERFGAGQLDPFYSYPIPVNDAIRALIANIFEPGTNHSRQMRGSWFPVSLSCPAAFHNTLANSQNYIFEKLRGYLPSQDEGPALEHHHKALQATNAMMNDPQQCKSDEALGAVASLMCHQAILGKSNGEAWHKHRNALLNIINLRGGFDGIDKLDHLRLTLSWADLIGSFSQDISPAIPMPQQWQLDSKSPPGSPCACSTISLKWKVDSPSRLDWISIFDDVAQLIVLDRAFNEEQLTLAITSGSWIEPTMWRLLSICPLQLGNDREHVIEEVCRLGTLLFLAPLWRTLGQNPVWTTAISRKLLIVLTTYMCEWKELKPLLIWTLYFAAIETQNLTERGQLVFMLAVIASGMQAATWDGIMQIIKDVIWCEKVFAGTEDLIRDEVMVIIWQRSSQFVFDSELGAPSGEIVGSND